MALVCLSSNRSIARAFPKVSITLLCYRNSIICQACVSRIYPENRAEDAPDSRTGSSSGLLAQNDSPADDALRLSWPFSLLIGKFTGIFPIARRVSWATPQSGHAVPHIVGKSPKQIGLVIRETHGICRQPTKCLEPALNTRTASKSTRRKTPEIDVTRQTIHPRGTKSECRCR